MTESCLHCGREIQGPAVEVPEGDTYHYACVDVRYPEPSMPEDILDGVDPDNWPEGLIDFFDFSRKNPYISVDRNKLRDEIPEVLLSIDTPMRIDLTLQSSEFSFDVYHETKELNIAPWVFYGVHFGAALERKYPAYSDRDHLYPRGHPKVREETNENEFNAEDQD